MASSFKKDRGKKLGLGIILWIIIIVLAAIFMLWAFLKEAKNEEEYQRHKEVEHGHTSRLSK